MICVFAASFNCCLYTSLPLLHVSDFIAICNFRRDALLFAYFLVVVSFVACVLSLCNARRETTIAIHNIIIIYFGAFLYFLGFLYFFTDQQNETLRRDAS